MKQGVNTIAALRERSRIDPATHCWHWQGCTRDGRPRIWAPDIDRIDKRVLSGPRAVWFIAHGTPLGNLVAYMACWTRDCVCPSHVRCGTRADFSTAMARAGLLKGHHVVRRASAIKARAAAGIVDIPAHVVLALRDLAPTTTPQALAMQFGISQQSIRRMLRGASYSHVVAQPKPAPPS